MLLWKGASAVWWACFVLVMRRPAHQTPSSARHQPCALSSHFSRCLCACLPAGRAPGRAQGASDQGRRGGWGGRRVSWKHTHGLLGARLLCVASTQHAFGLCSPFPMQFMSSHLPICPHAPASPLQQPHGDQWRLPARVPARGTGHALGRRVPDQGHALRWGPRPGRRMYAVAGRGEAGAEGRGCASAC